MEVDALGAVPAEQPHVVVGVAVEAGVPPPVRMRRGQCAPTVRERRQPAGATPAPAQEKDGGFGQRHGRLSFRKHSNASVKASGCSRLDRCPASASTTVFIRGSTAANFPGPQEKRFGGGIDLSYRFWGSYSVFAQYLISDVKNRQFRPGDDGFDHLVRLELNRSFR